MRWQDTGSMQISTAKIFFGACDEKRPSGSGFVVNKLLTVIKSYKVINSKITILTLTTK